MSTNLAAELLYLRRIVCKLYAGAHLHAAELGPAVVM